MTFLVWGCSATMQYGYTPSANIFMSRFAGTLFFSCLVFYIGFWHFFWFYTKMTRFCGGFPPVFESLVTRHIVPFLPKNDDFRVFNPGNEHAIRPHLIAPSKPGVFSQGRRRSPSTCPKLLDKWSPKILTWAVRAALDSCNLKLPWNFGLRPQNFRKIPQNSAKLPQNFERPPTT